MHLFCIRISCDIVKIKTFFIYIKSLESRKETNRVEVKK
jgi:hypothetical protein